MAICNEELEDKVKGYSLQKQTDAGQLVIPMCRYASQATQLHLPMSTFNGGVTLLLQFKV